jgi:hypothetical protein
MAVRMVQIVGWNTLTRFATVGESRDRARGEGEGGAKTKKSGAPLVLRQYIQPGDSSGAHKVRLKSPRKESSTCAELDARKTV